MFKSVFGVWCKHQAIIHLETVVFTYHLTRQGSFLQLTSVKATSLFHQRIIPSMHKVDNNGFLVTSPGIFKTHKPQTYNQV